MYILEEQGFETHQAENGQLGLDTFNREGSFDVLLVDWEMPVMNGLDLVRTIRAQEDGQKLKILMITTHNSMSDLVAALSMGIDDYLMKPIEEDSVVDRLRMMELID